MDATKIVTVAGWALAAGLAGYLFFNRAAPPLPPTVAPVAATAAPTPSATPTEPTPLPTETPSVLDILNSRFPATAAGAKQSATQIVHDPRPIVISEPPASPALSAPPTASTPVRSSLDVEREKTALVVPALERMATSAQEVTRIESEMKAQCVGVIEMPYVDPYGNRVAGTMNKENTPECLARKTRLGDLKTALPRESADLQDVARRNGILPGLLRELVAKYGLEHYVRP